MDSKFQYETLDQHTRNQEMPNYKLDFQSWMKDCNSSVMVCVLYL
jgi:hypothetical protein